MLEGKYPMNTEIVENLQDIFNLMPNLNFETIIQSFSVKTNDFMHMTYVCSLIRAIIGVHNLIDRQFEVREKKIKDDKDEKEKMDKLKEDKKNKENKEKEEKEKKASQDKEMTDN